jgi:DNA-binding transcriptional ArsR family regulator
VVFFKIPKQKQTIFKLIEIRVVPLMTKVNLDINAFKALASETRLNILKVLDRKKMSLNEICTATDLNKATLHEHLLKLNEAGLVKRKEREGHKWVYYKLSWKGSSLLHPENTKIVVMFSATFITLISGIYGLINYFRQKAIATRDNIWLSQEPPLKGGINETNDEMFSLGGSYLSQDPIFLYLAIACISIFAVLLVISIWKYKKNKEIKL